MGDVFCHPTPGRLPAALTLTLAWAFLWPASSQAQGAWEALLTIDPYPSPYYSDWDVNPNIGSLTVLNHGASPGDVRVVFNIIDRSNRIIASGRSEPQTVPVGAAVIFDSPYELAGTSSHDADIERIAERTGRLPEGAYTACAAATDLDGFILSEACAEFTILYPDPPLLLGPMDGAALDRQDELFQWTPVQVPVQFQAQYVLRIAEVLEGQTPAEALGSNIPQFESFELFAPNLQYPLDARPFEVGKTYAWSVRAFDQNGYPLSANQGRSEIWTFEFVDDATLVATPPVGELELAVEFFDPDQDTPELFRLLTEGSHEEALTYVLGALSEGRLTVPLPRPELDGAGAATGGDDGGVGPPPAMDAPDMGGPSPYDARPAATPVANAGPAAASCLSFMAPRAVASLDTVRKSLAVQATFGGTPIRSMLECYGVPVWSMPPQYQEMSLLFVLSWGDGLPRTALAIKPPLFDFIDNVQLEYAVFIIDPLGEFTLRSADLPVEVAAFFGDHEIEVWGPSVGEVARRVWRTAKSQPAAGGLGRLLGINFYGVMDLHGPVGEFARLVGVIEPEATLRGFVGSREKTFRGARLGLTGETSGRDDLRLRDNWFLAASIPTRPPPWLPWVTDRRFEVEVGSQDSSVAAVPGFLAGEGDMRTRYRVLIRDVMGGFDQVKPWVGVDPDSTLELFAELKLESAGATTTLGQPRTEVTRSDTGGVRSTETRSVSDSTSAWSRTQLSVTYGTRARLDLFCGVVNLFDPKLIVSRAEPGAGLRSNPLNNLAVFLGADLGIRGSALGTVDFQISRRPAPRVDTAAAKDAASRRRETLKAEADSLEARYWEIQEGLSEEAARLPPDDTAAAGEAIRNDEILRVLMAEARSLRQRADRARREYEEAARKDGVPASKPKMHVKVTARLDQGASIAWLLGLGKDVATAAWGGSGGSVCP